MKHIRLICLFCLISLPFLGGCRDEHGAVQNYECTPGCMGGPRLTGEDKHQGGGGIWGGSEPNSPASR